MRSPRQACGTIEHHYVMCCKHIRFLQKNCYGRFSAFCVQFAQTGCHKFLNSKTPSKPSHQSLDCACGIARTQIWTVYDVSMAIPQIIHQTVESLEQVLPAFESNRKYMSLNNPSWDFKLYTTDDREDFIRSAYGKEILNAYLSIDYRYGAARADFFRYLVILELGGLYLDIKATATKKLNSVINVEDAFITAQWPLYIDGTDIASIGVHKDFNFREYQNWFILAEPKHLILERVVEEVLKNISNYNPFTCGVGKLGVLRTTGPIAYSKVVHKYVNSTGVRVASNEQLGLRPSIDKITDVQNPFPNKQSIPHYSSLRIPIISKSRITTIFVYSLFTAHQKCKRLLKKITRKI